MSESNFEVTPVGGTEHIRYAVPCIT